MKSEKTRTIKWYSSRWWGYPLAILSIALATWLKYLAQPDIIPTQVPILYLVAIVPSAIFFGLGPALLACVLSVLAFNYFFIPPLYTLSPVGFDDVIFPAIYLGVAVSFSLLSANLRRKNDSLKAEIKTREQKEAELARYQGHLEELVKQRTSELDTTNAKLTEEVSLHKKSEEMLLAKEAELELIVNDTPFLLARCSRDLHYRYASHAYAAMIGRTPDQVAGKPIIEIMGEKGFETIRPYVESVLQGQEVEYEDAVDFIGVGPRQLRVHYTPERNEQSQVVGWIASIIDISERKQAEEALRESNRNYRSLFNNQTIALAYAKTIFNDQNQPVDYIVLDVNPSWEKQVGVPRGQVIGKKITKAFPGVSQDLIDRHNRVAVTGQEAHFEIHEPTIDMWFDVNVYSPQKGYFVAMSYNITERKKAEEAMKESEERFRNLANSIPQLAWRANPDGYITWYNDNWYRYTGTTPEQMEGWGWESVHDPAELPKVLERWKASIATGEPFDMIFPLRGADGQFRSYLTRVQPFKDSAGRVVQWFGTNTDITALKKAQSQLEYDLATLTRMHDLSGKLLETGGLPSLLQEIMDTAVAIMRAEHGTLQLLDNGGSLRIVAFNGHKQPFLDFFAAAENVTSVCGEATKRGERVVVPDVETSPLFMGTSSLPVFREAGIRAVQSTPIMSRQGRLLGVLTTQWDVPCLPDEHELWRIDLLARQAADLIEYAQADEALIKYTKDLEAANKDLEAFGYSVTHDMKQPLRALGSYSELLYEDYKDKLDETGKDYLGRINKASHFISELTEDMLKLSRITRAEMVREPVDLSAVAQSIIEEFKADQPSRKTEIKIDSSLSVSGDKPLLTVALRNLIENAWKFTLKCQIARINLGSMEKDGERVYFIKDNGIGFDMKYKDKLFQPFQRLTTDKDYPGTGIGLAIVQRVIRRHRGKIWAEAELGKGAAFYFTLMERK